jgi:hypothetical protein
MPFGSWGEYSQPPRVDQEDFAMRARCGLPSRMGDYIRSRYKKFGKRSHQPGFGLTGFIEPAYLQR